MNRRSLFQVAAAPLVAAQTNTARTLVYEGRFVPPNAECKVAFGSDQHYWPGHRENWGGGTQITSSSDRRMPDLAEVLNAERPQLSIHGGDVISAAGSFFPPPDEYARQLAFASNFYKRLNHPYVPMLGNLETLEGLYENESQLAAWRKHFGAPHRYHDVNGWRFVALNCLLPNPNGRHGKGDGYGNAYGLDPAQADWLRQVLKGAAKAIVCTHVPPSGWVGAAEFERIINDAGCVKAVLCGHVHRNITTKLGDLPVLVRVANVTTPFGYTMVHGYADGRVVLVQKSQHFPLEDFLSAGFHAKSPLGTEADRYMTLGGASEQLPLTGLKVIGDSAKAVIQDGHLKLEAPSRRCTVLIDHKPLKRARLSLTMVKAGADRIGGMAGDIEATLTAKYSTDGKVYLARGKEVLARSWFNIGDHIAYRLTLETDGKRVRASWKNMLDLEAPAVNESQFGFFVDRGTAFVTDLTLESLR
ncbi:MAG: hypothetical protein FJW38_15785 [Acidobacteria bacterium]|nr:hypothetical protein [Acidobacteriota bacterium]